MCGSHVDASHHGMREPHVHAIVNFGGVGRADHHHAVAFDSIKRHRLFHALTTHTLLYPANPAALDTVMNFKGLIDYYIERCRGMESGKWEIHIYSSQSFRKIALSRELL